MASGVTPGRIDAFLALRQEGRLLLGRDRIAILEAVAARGSITEAAKAAGFSYKAAWDAVNAINNLLPRPAVVAQPGGRGGGGAVVTEEGRRLIRAFRRLEEQLSSISGQIAEKGLEAGSEDLFWGIGMRTSARNAFRCVVSGIRRAAVNVEVTLRMTAAKSLVAVITNDSATELGIEVGRETLALVKSSFILMARSDEMPRVSAENTLPGTVAARIDGGVNTEIILDIGEGKTLTAVITRDGADELGLALGAPACALFSASHVILAVN